MSTFLGETEAIMGQFKQINSKTLQQTVSNPDAALHIIDIRDSEAFDKGHIPTAKRVAKDQLLQFVTTTTKTDPIIVYCYRGISCQRVAQYLVDEGFEQVSSLEGGYEAWVAAQAEADD